MSLKRKFLLGVLGLIVLALCLRSVIRVHTYAEKACTPNYYKGIVVDKGESNGRSSYRWIIADWYTADGRHIGLQEINAAGQPIHRLSINDTIYANASNMYGFFWFKVPAGAAYYPDEINYVDFIIATLVQIGLWALSIVAVVCLWSFIWRKLA